MRGLYVHIPFCEKKCLYCDFYSLETTHHMESFVDTLLREIDLRAAITDTNSRSISTVFFGGGTPSLLAPVQIERITKALSQHFHIEPTAEWTMECNPGTVSTESLAAYRALGINRLSFGVQSFFDDDLAFLTRIHSPAQAKEAVAMARRAGFDNINIDLIFALPGQTIERWKSNIETAVALQTEHISAYSLIFEEGTPLNAMKLRGEVHETDEDTDAEMYDITMNFLSRSGYRQYEVSNFARPGMECRHNLLYWQGREYISFGPSAHGYIGGTRYWNVRSLSRYTDDITKGVLPVVNSERIEGRTRMFERAFLELRAQGIEVAAFQRDFGIDVHSVLRPLFERTAGEDLLAIDSERIALTQKGYRLCDALTTEVIALLEDACGEQWQSIIPATDHAAVEEHSRQPVAISLPQNNE